MTGYGDGMRGVGIGCAGCINTSFWRKEGRGRDWNGVGMHDVGMHD